MINTHISYEFLRAFIVSLNSGRMYLISRATAASDIDLAFTSNVRFKFSGKLRYTCCSFMNSRSLRSNIYLRSLIGRIYLSLTLFSRAHFLTPYASDKRRRSATRTLLSQIKPFFATIRFTLPIISHSAT